MKPQVMHVESSNPSLRVADVTKVVCRKCGFAIFIHDLTKCPKCGASLRQKPQCVKCGFSDLQALSLDHVDGHGNEHRDELREKYKILTALQWYGWLKANGYPQEPNLQVLCMNCQWIKATEFHEW
jgi:ribosomal protein L37E